MTPRGIVAIGTSLGGLAALEELLHTLPPCFRTPVVVVQHRGPESSGLARALGRHTALHVSEPDDKERIEGGHVYVAPAGYHLLVEPDGFALSTEGPVNWARPSIDVLFESVAEAYGSGAVCVVLTGASADGAQGAACVKAHGGRVIVQDPATAESPVMPRAVIEVTEPDQVLGVSEMGRVLAELCE